MTVENGDFSSLLGQIDRIHGFEDVHQKREARQKAIVQELFVRYSFSSSVTQKFVFSILSKEYSLQHFPLGKSFHMQMQQKSLKFGITFFA